MSQSGECDRIQEALIDGKGTVPAVLQHLAACPSCREFQSRLGDLQGLGSLYRPAAFAAGAERIKNLIHQTPFPGDGGGGTCPGSAPGLSAGAAAGAGATGGLAGLGGTAVVVVATLAIGGWWATQPRSGLSGPDPKPAVSVPVGPTGAAGSTALTASAATLAAPASLAGAITPFTTSAPSSATVGAAGPGADVDAGH